MSDPRARIRSARASLAAPPRSQPHDRPAPLSANTALLGRAATPATRSRPRRRDQSDVLIGKQQGRMRCVGIVLARPDREVLYAYAKHQRITLGEALVDVLGETVDALQPPSRAPGRFGPRAAGRLRRNLDDPRTVYVLITPDEAVSVKEAADDRDLTVSALVSVALGRWAVTRLPAR